MNSYEILSQYPMLKELIDHLDSMKKETEEERYLRRRQGNEQLKLILNNINEIEEDDDYSTEALEEDRKAHEEFKSEGIDLFLCNPSVDKEDLVSELMDNYLLPEEISLLKTKDGRNFLNLLSFKNEKAQRSLLARYGHSWFWR